LAWNHRLSRAVLGAYVRAVLEFYRRRAREGGIRDGRTGTLTVIQRFGSGLNLNVHFHTVVLDGVFSQGRSGALEFHPAPAPSDEEVARVLDTARRRVGRFLARCGLEPGDDGAGPADGLADESPTLPGLASASVRGRIALGPRAEDLLVPEGYYVLTKRFSAKEERRRVVAAVYDPTRVPAERVAFENHLNYYHNRGTGLPVTVAKGLAAFLNSTLVDVYFRQFSGHTQVNATDLRSLRYPGWDSLLALGRRIGKSFPDQEELNRLVEEVVFRG